MSQGSFTCSKKSMKHIKLKDKRVRAQYMEVKSMKISNTWNIIKLINQTKPKAPEGYDG